MSYDLAPGTRIDHERYGEGIITKNNLTDYEVIFERGGKMSILKSSGGFTIVDEVEDTSNLPRISLAEAEALVTHVLEQYGATQEVVELGDRWNGGTMVLTPANPELQSKEIPIETFFHKIVMLRDRLRVMEQQINSHTKLTDEDKVNLQQYITRIYGSLTTFNLLFKEKDDYFVGSSKKD